MRENNRNNNIKFSFNKREKLAKAPFLIREKFFFLYKRLQLISCHKISSGY